MKENDLRQKNWRARKKNGKWIFLCTLFMMGVMLTPLGSKFDILDGHYDVHAYESLYNIQRIFYGDSQQELDDQEAGKGVVITPRYGRDSVGEYIDWEIKYKDDNTSWGSPKYGFMLSSDAEVSSDIEVYRGDTRLNRDTNHEYDVRSFGYGSPEFEKLYTEVYGSDRVKSGNGNKILEDSKNSGRFSRIVEVQISGQSGREPGFIKFKTRPNFGKTNRDITIAAALCNWNGKWVRIELNGPIDHDNDGMHSLDELANNRNPYYKSPRPKKQNVLLSHPHQLAFNSGGSEIIPKNYISNISDFPADARFEWKDGPPVTDQNSVASQTKTVIVKTKGRSKDDKNRDYSEEVQVVTEYVDDILPKFVTQPKNLYLLQGSSFNHLKLFDASDDIGVYETIMTIDANGSQQWNIPGITYNTDGTVSGNITADSFHEGDFYTRYVKALDEYGARVSHKGTMSSSFVTHVIVPKGGTITKTISDPRVTADEIKGAVQVAGNSIIGPDVKNNPEIIKSLEIVNSDGSPRTDELPMYGSNYRYL